MCASHTCITYVHHICASHITSHVCITYMHHIYASHMCITYVHHICASHMCITHTLSVCTDIYMCASDIYITCVHHICASHMCTTCVHHMCASHMCIACVPHLLYQCTRPTAASHIQCAIKLHSHEPKRRAFTRADLTYPVNDTLLNHITNIYKRITQFPDTSNERTLH